MSSRRGKGAANVATTPAPNSSAETKQKELVPGKLTEKDWEDLIAVDDGVETVYELIEEVVEKASDIVFERYIRAEIYPYAVQAVKKSFLKILALEFVARDEGEKDTDTDPTWLPDEPPVPPPIDSWACGVIPLASSESLESLMDALDPIQVHKPVNLEEEKISSRSSTIITTVPSSLTSTKTTSKSRSTSKSMGKTVSGKKRKGNTKMPALSSTSGGVRPSYLEARLVPLERPPDGFAGVKQSQKEEADEQTSLQASGLPAPLNEPNTTPFDLGAHQTWVKGVKYDSKGNIVDMMKLDPAKFPSHSTKARVSIIYPPKDTVRQRAKGKSLDTFTSILKKTPKGHPSKSSLQNSSELERQYPGRAVAVMPSDAGLSKKDSARRFPSLPTLPALVDTIDPLPGVTVRERGRVIQGPTPLYHLPISPGLPLRPVKPLGDGGVAAGGGV